MNDDADGGDIDDLRNRFRGQGKAARKAQEAKRISATDGRRRRATGRTVQLNLRCLPDMKDFVQRIAAERNILMIEVLEEALRGHYKWDVN